MVHRGGCKLVSLQYRPSRLEQRWLEKSKEWGPNGFCDHMDEFRDQVASWLAATEHMRAANATSDLNPMVFSSYLRTYNCRNRPVTRLEWIEPLSHGLRHPNALCNGSAHVAALDYILLASKSDILNAQKLDGGCVGRPCQVIYMDMGASGYSDTPGQNWFVRMYAQRGIEFDRMLLWEAHTRTPSDIWGLVP